MANEHRSPSAIARDICAAIAEQYHEKPAAKQPAFITYARPYLQALRQSDDWGGMYGADTVKSCGLYALSNLAAWRGEAAKKLKAELKSACM